MTTVVTILVCAIFGALAGVVMGALSDAGLWLIARIRAASARRRFLRDNPRNNPRNLLIRTNLSDPTDRERP